MESPVFLLIPHQGLVKVTVRASHPTIFPNSLIQAITTSKRVGPVWAYYETATTTTKRTADANVKTTF